MSCTGPSVVISVPAGRFPLPRLRAAPAAQADFLFHLIEVGAPEALFGLLRRHQVGSGGCLCRPLRALPLSDVCLDLWDATPVPG